MNKKLKQVTCHNCDARSSSLFADLDHGETSCLNKDKSISYYKKGQSVFLAGAEPRGVFCVNRGKIKIFSRGEEGKEQIIHIAKKGEVIGFRAMFSENPYVVTAETLEECAICFNHL